MRLRGLVPLHIVELHIFIYCTGIVFNFFLLEGFLTAAWSPQAVRMTLNASSSSDCPSSPLIFSMRRSPRWCPAEATVAYFMNLDLICPTIPLSGFLPDSTHESTHAMMDMPLDAIYDQVISHKLAQHNLASLLLSAGWS